MELMTHFKIEAVQRIRMQNTYLRVVYIQRKIDCCDAVWQVWVSFRLTPTKLHLMGGDCQYYKISYTWSHFVLFSNLQ